MTVVRIYRMKININKSKTMVTGRKPKKTDIRIVVVEFYDTFKHLRSSVSLPT